MGAGNHTIQTLPIVTVRLKTKNSDTFVTSYAFLDSGNTVNFCTMEIARALHLEGRKTELNLTTMGQHRTESCSILHDLEVSDFDDEHTIKLPLCFTPNLIYQCQCLGRISLH